MSGSTLEFYDNLAENYHLIAKDWDNAVRCQGKTLQALIQKHLPDAAHLKILDCSCGIGTHAIGLALLGFDVHATDLSPKAIERAKAESARLGARVSFGIADFRSLDHDVDGQFDVVISCDNSLPHLLTNPELE